jgi:hypothetical protein
MARLLQIPKEEHLHFLRVQITNKYSKPIVNSFDCKHLEETIEAALNKRISVDTLARLFGIKKGKSLPSIYTLNTCSNFVGYKDWNDLVSDFQKQSLLYQKNFVFEIMNSDVSFNTIKNQLSSFTKSTEIYEIFHQIIIIKAQQKDTEFFIHIFQFKSLFEFDEEFKFNIYHTIHLLGVLCIKNEWLSEIAIKNYFNLGYVEDYFVEWLVVPEQAYYLKILENYHNCNNIKIDKVVFYHLINCTRASDINDWVKFKIHYQKIMLLNINPNNLHELLQMRWYGVQLLNEYALQNESNLNSICKKIVKNYAINTSDYGNRVSNVFIISTYLYKINNFSLIINLVDEKVLKQLNILGYWADLNFNQLKVYYVFSLLQTNQFEKAKLYFHEINPQKFDLNFKNQILRIYNTSRSTIFEKYPSCHAK